MKNIDIIERFDSGGGLLSYALTAIDTMMCSIENGRIPIVDWTKSNSPQVQHPCMFGKINPFDYYFQQPFDLNICNIQSIDDVQHVKFDGFKTLNFNRIRKNVIGRSLLKFNDNIVKLANDFYLNYIKKFKTLGVLIRGTDYVTCRPYGHQVQPSLDMVIADIEKIKNIYEIERVFIVTESELYFNKLKMIFGDSIISIQDRFFENTSGEFNTTFLYRKFNYDNNRLIDSNSKYLASLYIMLKLDYVLMSHTNFSELYQYLEVGIKTYEKIYNLGTY